MPTLYNQYIYRDGAWRQTGTSSDSVTYQLSLSEDTLTLTGSDGSTSSVSISGGGSDNVYIMPLMSGTVNWSEVRQAVADGKLIIMADYGSDGANDFAVATSVHIDPNNPEGESSNNYVMGGIFYGNGSVIEAITVKWSQTDGWSMARKTIPSATTTTPSMDGTAAVGSETKYARGDHVHPSDTSKVSTSTTINGKALSSNINLTASDVGALPDNTEIPEKTSDLTNDSNFVSDANYVHTDNNFTDTLEAKLNGIAEGATVDDHKWNDVVLYKSNGLGGTGYQVPILATTSATTAYLRKATYNPEANNIAQFDGSAMLNSSTPTAGDSSTKVATTAFVSDAIGTAISGVNSFEYEVVQSLPTTNIKDHTIYLVAKTGSTGDVYDEYLYINNAWEHIGSTDVDLSGYVPTTRKVNNKALSSDITLSASDVGALPDSTVIPAQIAKIWTGTCSTGSNVVDKVVTLDDATGFSLTDGVKIAVTFTNGQTNGLGTLNVNNTGAKDIAIKYNVNGTGTGARDDICWGQDETVFFTYNLNQWLFEGSGYLHSKTYNLASNAVPKTRTVNGKALSSNITLTASDVGATDKNLEVRDIATNAGEDIVGFLIFGNGTSSQTRDYDTKGLYYQGSYGAGNGTPGKSYLTLGNNYNSYQGANKQGKIVLYGAGAYAHTIEGNPLSHRTITLPDATGTVALTSDIPNISGKQDKPTITSTTLAVASWSNGVYSFESAYPNASYNIDIEPDGYTITDAQFKAWNEAKIVGNSNGNTIKALGTVPTVAIPIVVRATPK